ncbi:MAG: pyridoxamine 5'-phosphate oxidase family protein [Acidimicrobiales bacterium]
MNLPAAMTGLALHIEQFGPIAHLVTVGSKGAPHVVSVRVGWDGPELAVAAGRRSATNVEARSDVTLLWGPTPGSSYSLIVDGTARLRTGGLHAMLAIEPTSALLHRSAKCDASSPMCITVLAKP